MSARAEAVNALQRRAELAWKAAVNEAVKLQAQGLQVRIVQIGPAEFNVHGKKRVQR